MRNLPIIIALAVLVFSGFSCAEDSPAPSNGSIGTGGSLARFTIVDPFLYTLSVTTLKVFDISNADEPVLIESVNVGFGVETLFPFGEWLFMGTNNGMLIYQIQENGVPTYVSTYEHIISCDPVVTDGSTAFVTLRISDCRMAIDGGFDVVESIDVTDITNPTIITAKELNAPRGLGLDGDVLFVCDGEAGLWVFDVSDPSVFEVILRVEDITAYDVIPQNGNLLVLGPDNIYQFDYTNLPALPLISQLEL